MSSIKYLVSAHPVFAHTGFCCKVRTVAWCCALHRSPLPYPAISRHEVVSLHLQRHTQVSCRWSLHNVQCWIPIKLQLQKSISNNALVCSFFLSSSSCFFSPQDFHSEGWAFTRYFALSTSLSQKWVVWLRCVVVIYCLSSSSCSLHSPPPPPPPHQVLHSEGVGIYKVFHLIHKSEPKVGGVVEVCGCYLLYTGCLEGTLQH